ncbi:MAG: hypothetical protein ACLFVJ_20615 [Persicimonas sp.]
MIPRIPLLTLTTLLFLALVVPISCNDGFEGSLPRRDQLNFPVGVEFHPNGDYLYVVNSNFDARFRPDSGGTVSVIDAETLELLPEATPFMPSFGSSIQLNEAATKAYATARADDVVVAFDVADDGSALFCTNDDGERTSDPASCVLDRVPDEPGGAQLPWDPFDLAVFTVDSDAGPVDVVNLSHIGRDGSRAETRVASITLPGADFSAASMQTAPLITGGNAIVQRPGTQHLYVAGRDTNGVAIFQPFIDDQGEVEAIIQRGSFALNRSRTGQGDPLPVDARALEFDETGDRLFAVTQLPAALHKIQLVPSDPDEGTGTDHKVVSSIPLPDDPTDIKLHTTPQGQRLAYVASFNDESIQVVDLDSETIIDEILLDASPYKIAIEPETSGCSTPGERCRAFVTLFDDTPNTVEDCSESESGCGSVAVIDINPLHRDPENPSLSRYHTVTSKIR